MAGRLPCRTGKAGTGGLYLASGRCALLALSAGTGERARGHGRGGYHPVPAHPLRARRVLLLRSCRAREPLDRAPVLVLLPLQRLALGLLRCQRPRIRLGDDHPLPVRVRRWRGTPPMGRVRFSRLLRRRLAPSLGRSGAGESRRASGGLRGRGFSRQLLCARRIPVRVGALLPLTTGENSGADPDYLEENPEARRGRGGRQ